MVHNPGGHEFHATLLAVELALHDLEALELGGEASVVCDLGPRQHLVAIPTRDTT